jgi:glutamine synthetase
MMLNALKSVLPKGRSAATTRSVSGLLEGYGDHVFKGAVAESYLSKQGLAAGTLDNSEWTKDAAAADKVAAAVLEWATENDATSFCHVFQPLGASGVRHGLVGQVQNAFFKFDSAGKPVWDLKGKDILAGETDGSSYPNGGLRGTHCAGGYVSVDPTSPIFLRGDCIFIPSTLCSYYGDALDEKTPLLRSVDALNSEGTRLLSKLGFDVGGLQSNIGLEQEIFLIPRDQYVQRLDLMMTGRTIMGADAPRGQEMCDHYMASPSSATAALACMQEIQAQCFRLGIPLVTRHREVAPNQYEFAPQFGTATTQIDQNVTLMQIIEEVAPQYGLAALLQEKPFNNVNGSGKHNNWSIGTSEGVNLLNVGQVTDKSGSPDVFPTIMAAIVGAVDDHGDLLRMAIASPGNDFRLGACEAPPAIVSTYLGEDMTSYLEAYAAGGEAEYKPGTKALDMGVAAMKKLDIPAQDRNRTSPFPYGGHRFEFRAVGSAQNVSLVNTVLNTITAAAFKKVADRMDAGESARDVATELIKTHVPKVVFNGDNYDEANQDMLTKRGVWRIDSGVEAICRYSAPKNTALFEEMGVLRAEECAARQQILLDHYVGVVDMEAKCMIDMINKHVIPSVKAAGLGPLADLEAAVGTLEAAVHAIEESEGEAQATLARDLRLETMEAIRAHCDAAEKVCPASLWTLPTYVDLMFLDQTSNFSYED